MSGLNCGTSSRLAWPYLRDGLDAAVAVANSEAAAAARDLAGYGIPAGPCGGAALAGVRAALTGEGARSRRAALGSRFRRHGGAAEHRRIGRQPGAGRLTGQARAGQARGALPSAPSSGRRVPSSGVSARPVPWCGSRA